MGGLRTKIPITFWTMFIATFAIAGIPGFAGFFSKDEILEAARSGPNANVWLWLLGLIGAGLTSFYMFRLIFLTFFGKPRYDEHKVHVHESPRSMTVPLIILAILSTVGGWAAAPHLIGGTEYFDKFLHPVFATYAPAATAGAEAAAEVVEAPGIMLLHALTGWPVLIALAGLLLAWWFYIKSPQTPKKLVESLRAPYTLVLHKYYVDELYNAAIIQPLLWISKCALARDRRRRDRRHSERCSPRRSRIWRRATRNSIRQRAQLRHLGGNRRSRRHRINARTLGNGALAWKCNLICSR